MVLREQKKTTWDSPEWIYDPLAFLRERRLWKEVVGQMGCIGSKRSGEWS
jgi:hypothetical protein